ncbi:DUF4340 domain-containing protein [Desulfovibrio ferrophilus]|uniref:DUF4340 domain-containing protein n=1 Tax=Desulfovibrio ferrophilus TaxID=241368 RepID=UPI000F8452AC|nr:DUF4340 domain-containing protein [Desulfovibrio ferrophilus]
MRFLRESLVPAEAGYIAMRIGALVFFFLIAVVAAGIVLTRQAVIPAPQDERWPEYSAAAADRVILEGPSGVFELLRQDGAWRLRLPDRGVLPLAESRKVEALLEFLALNKPIRRLSNSAGPGGGFQPRAAVTVEGRSRLEIGGDDGSGVGVFARMADKPGLMVLSKDYADVLGRLPAAYLDTRLMDLSVEDVLVIRMSSMHEGWEIQRKKEEFVFVKPDILGSSRVQREAMDLWLHELGALQAVSLAPMPPEQGRLPDLALILRQKGGRNSFLKLWRPLDDSKPWMVSSSRQDVFFLLDQERVEKLNRNAFSLIDRRLVLVELGQVRRLELTHAGRVFIARRDGENWRSEGAGELTGIDMRLWRLTDLQYEYGPVGALPASAEQALRLVLKGEKGVPLLDLVFYTDSGLPGGQCWAGRYGEKAFHPVDSRLFMDLKGMLPPLAE